jgi:Uma2 family endonuclease
MTETATTIVTAWDIHPETEKNDRRVYVANYPIDFNTWISFGDKLDTELVRGVMRHKMAAQYRHEWIFAWLMTVLTGFVSARKLGRVLGSRTAVRITKNDGRSPDLVFVRHDNLAIIHRDAIHGVPDLAIEIVSDNDRPSDLIPLEADYRMLGVPEIVFIDPRKARVKQLRRMGDGYTETLLNEETLTFATVPGFVIQVPWLFLEDKPDPFATL